MIWQLATLVLFSLLFFLLPTLSPYEEEVLCLTEGFALGIPVFRHSLPGKRELVEVQDGQCYAAAFELGDYGMSRLQCCMTSLVYCYGREHVTFGTHAHEALLPFLC